MKLRIVKQWEKEYEEGGKKKNTARKITLRRRMSCLTQRQVLSGQNLGSLHFFGMMILAATLFRSASPEMSADYVIDNAGTNCWTPV